MNVDVTITGDGIPLSGITIEITLSNGVSSPVSKTVVTGSNGNAKVSWKNAPDGCYFATLDNVIIPSGYSWDSNDPLNTGLSEDKSGNPC